MKWRIVALQLLALGLLYVTMVAGETTQFKSSARFRIHTDFFINQMNNHNAEVFKNFTNINISRQNDSLVHSELIWFTFLPDDGVDLQDFKMNYVIKPNYFGFHMEKVMVKGNVTTNDGTQANWTAKVPGRIKWNGRFEFLKYGELMNGVPLKHDKVYWKELEWKPYKTGEVVAEGVSDEVKKEIELALDKKVNYMKEYMWQDDITTLCPWGSTENECSYKVLGRYVGSVYDEKYFPEHEYKRIPWTPYNYFAHFYNFVYYYASLMRYGENFGVDKDGYFNIGLNSTNFRHLYPFMDRRGKIKNITTNFQMKKNEAGDRALLQAIVDESFFNNFLLVLSNVTSKPGYNQEWGSLRFDVLMDRIEKEPHMNKDAEDGFPRLKGIVECMRTYSRKGFINAFFKQKIIPLREEFGDVPFDIKVSFSHSRFLKKVPNAKQMGVYIDKKGNIIVNLNVIFKIMVETKPNVWKTAREIYITVIGKVNVDFDKTDPKNKLLGVSLKKFEISNLKIFNVHREEQENEQIMIQSAVNLQLEGLIQKYASKKSALKRLLLENKKVEVKKFFNKLLFNFQAIRYLKCLNVLPTDMDVTFKKGQFQFSLYYKDGLKHKNFTHSCMFENRYKHHWNDIARAFPLIMRFERQKEWADFHAKRKRWEFRPSLEHIRADIMAEKKRKEAEKKLKAAEMKQFMADTILEFSTKKFVQNQSHLDWDEYWEQTLETKEKRKLLPQEMQIKLESERVENIRNITEYWDAQAINHRRATMKYKLKENLEGEEPDDWEEVIDIEDRPTMRDVFVKKNFDMEDYEFDPEEEGTGFWYLDPDKPGEETPAVPHVKEDAHQAKLTKLKAQHKERIKAFENLRKGQEELLEQMRVAKEKFNAGFIHGQDTWKENYDKWAVEQLEKGITMEANPNYKYSPSQVEALAKYNEKRLQDPDNAHIKFKKVEHPSLKVFSPSQ